MTPRLMHVDWGGIVPGGLLLLIVLAGLLAPWISPYDPFAQDILGRLAPPVWEPGGAAAHPLGTDQLGRDTLARLLYGARLTLIVGFAGTFISAGAGTGLGLFAGYFVGWIDRVIMRLVDIQLAFPRILLAVSVIAMLGADVRNLVLVLGVAGWVDYARIVRANLLSIREKEFIVAANCIGLPHWRIMLLHGLPNTISPVIVIGSLAVATNIVLESSLSFLGLGVGAESITWGTMMADARNYVGVQGWLAVLPGLAITLTVLGVNLLGGWLRDALDPRLRT
jgi:peptide/nickel transport system permease protein